MSCSLSQDAWHHSIFALVPPFCSRSRGNRFSRAMNVHSRTSGQMLGWVRVRQVSHQSIPSFPLSRWCSRAPLVLAASRQYRCSAPIPSVLCSSNRDAPSPRYPGGPLELTLLSVLKQQGSTRLPRSSLPVLFPSKASPCPAAETPPWPNSQPISHHSLSLQQLAYPTQRESGTLLVVPFSYFLHPHPRCVSTTRHFDYPLSNLLKTRVS